MLAWILRSLMFLAALITGLFISCDELNFDIVQTLIAIVLIAVSVLAGAVWTLLDRPSRLERRHRPADQIAGNVGEGMVECGDNHC